MKPIRYKLALCVMIIIVSGIMSCTPHNVKLEKNSNIEKKTVTNRITETHKFSADGDILETTVITELQDVRTTENTRTKNETDKGSSKLKWFLGGAGVFCIILFVLYIRFKR